MEIESRLLNYVNGQWKPSNGADYLDVTNPATGQVLTTVPLTPAREVDAAVQAAAKAFEGWRRIPATDRIQYLFALKNLLEENLDNLARTLTQECGKTYKESIGEFRRGIENVETACGIPSLMQGYNNEDIAAGIDEHMIRLHSLCRSMPPSRPPRRRSRGGVASLLPTASSISSP